MKARLVKENINDLFVPRSKEDIIKQLSKLNQDEKAEKLIGAAVTGQLDIIKLLIEAGVNINKAIYGYIALISASKNRHLKAVKLLLEAGANVNAKDNYGYTALMWAYTNRDPHMIKLLIDSGADNVK
jgi:ankyrin repeat protein